MGLEEEKGIAAVGNLEFMNPNGRKQFFKMYRGYITGEDQHFTYLDPKIKMTVKFLLEAAELL